MGSKSKQPAARLGDIDTGHPPAPPTPIITASGNVFINGIPAARKGDMLAPHHPGVRIITEGSNSVKINGMPAARITDAINCGGTIVVGSGNVLIGDSPPSGSPLAPGEWDDYLAVSSNASATSPYQDQQMRADAAVKYRGDAGATESWNTYYSNISPKQRPAPSSVLNPAERAGLEQTNLTPPVPAPTLPNPVQQQVIDSAGQQMMKAIANLTEGAMVTPEMLNLASTMVQAGVQTNNSIQSSGNSVANKSNLTTVDPSANLSGKEAIAAKRVYQQSFNSPDTLVIGRLEDTAAGTEIGMGRLNDPDWTINVNDAWVQGGINAGKPFYLGSNISIKNLRSGNPVYPKTIFFRELSQLRDAGYYRQGDWMLPPKS